MILEVLHTGPFDVNTYILIDDDSKEAVLFDVGGDFEKINDKLNTQGYKLKYILNTHGHFDHVLGQAQIQNKYPDLKIYINKADARHYEHLADTVQSLGIDEAVPPLKPFAYVDESTELYIGNMPIKVFETPGHSKGSVCYLVENKLLSGDTLFYSTIGRTDFIDGDFDELISSVKNKLFSLPDDTVVYPGHGPKTTIGYEKTTNPYLK